MEHLYVIAWKSNVTGMRGNGTLAMRLVVAIQQCRVLNKRHPTIWHYPELADVYKGSSRQLHITQPLPADEAEKLKAMLDLEVK